MSASSSEIKTAAQLLKEGELVALPTETVYGLGADATNLEALRKLYRVKGRPQSHPVIVHLHSLEQIKDWAIELPDSFFILAEKFWPGPLTMIVRRAQGVLDAVTGGQDTVGLRMPSHPVAIALLKEFGRGLAAPSANKFGRISPTTALAVKEEFGSELKMVLDGGACEVGIESTIVDLSHSSFQPRILRPGMILPDDLFMALQKEHEDKTDVGGEDESAAASEAPRVPGALPSHYAPVTRTDLVPSHLLRKTIEQYADRKSLAVISFSPLSVEGLIASNLIVAEQEPFAYARSLYANLRALDRLKQSLIIVEEPPQTPEWSGIRDRLLRASSK
jgi:L-threonylcarbamoyladenylate synthase